MRDKVVAVSTTRAGQAATRIDVMDVLPEFTPPEVQPADAEKSAVFATEIRTHLRVRRDLDAATAKLDAIAALCEAAEKQGWWSVDRIALQEVLEQ